MQCLIQASDTAFSKHNPTKGSVKPGWSDYVAELYSTSSDVAKLGGNAGKPRQGYLHRYQPSRIRRDSPAFSSDVPRSREISRCPAFFENGIIIFFVADYSTCLPRNATK